MRAPQTLRSVLLNRERRQGAIVDGAYGEKPRQLVPLHVPVHITNVGTFCVSSTDSSRSSALH